jgi:hypothetical protein
VTQGRQSGLTDAEIAMLIGDKTGPSLIAQVYGDLRPDHLLAQARRIRLTASAASMPGSSPDCMPTLPLVRVDAPKATEVHLVSETA